MRTSATMVWLALLFAPAAPGPSAAESAPVEPLPAAERVGAEAERVEFTLETGSCWGQSSEHRVVRVRPDHVLVSNPRSKAAGARRSLAWWGKTRKLLNRGLAGATRRPANGDCYVANWICGFEIKVVVGGKQTVISGCCNRSKEAKGVEEAFRRLKPGGPLGPDRPPAPQR